MNNSTKPKEKKQAKSKEKSTSTGPNLKQKKSDNNTNKNKENNENSGLINNKTNVIETKSSEPKKRLFAITTYNEHNVLSLLIKDNFKI